MFRPIRLRRRDGSCILEEMLKQNIMGENNMVRGVPKRDGSGRGRRANRGRGGCGYIRRTGRRR